MKVEYVTRNSKNEFLPQKGKLKALLDDGAVVVKATKYVKGLVCLIDSKNGVFESALVVEPEDFQELLKDDGRSKIFLILKQDGEDRKKSNRRSL